MLYFSADGKWIDRDRVGCFRRDIVAHLTQGNGTQEARRRLARLLAEQWGECEFCEWAISRLEG